MQRVRAAVQIAAVAADDKFAHANAIGKKLVVGRTVRIMFRIPPGEYSRGTAPECEWDVSGKRRGLSEHGPLHAMMTHSR